MKRYLFYFNIIAITFFMACNSQPKNTEDLKVNYTNLDNALVKQTFDTLKSSLQTSIKNSGFEGAVPFCQAAAYPLTNTYTSDSVTITRTALRVRNSLNEPDSTEVRILKMFASLKEQGIANDSIKPIVEISKNNLVHFYKPIMMQQMCTSCHGEKDIDILPATWEAITKTYPLDKAYDFKTGDLRGMWHVIFRRN